MPVDPTPHGGEVLHRPPDRARIPEPKPGQPGDAPVDGQPGEARDALDIGERPSLPEHPQLTVADIEDEDADPVIESGPGSAGEATGKPSVTQQPA